MIILILNDMHLGLILHSVLDILNGNVRTEELKSAVVCVILNLKLGLRNRLAADIVERAVLDSNGVIVVTCTIPQKILW